MEAIGQIHVLAALPQRTPPPPIVTQLLRLCVCVCVCVCVCACVRARVRFLVTSSNASIFSHMKLAITHCVHSKLSVIRKQ